MSTEERSPDSRDDATVMQDADAAVRRALIESRNDLLKYLRRRLGSRDEAEEIFQQFSLRALGRASDLRDVNTVRGWLGRVLTSVIVDSQRHTTRKRRHETAIEQNHLETLVAEPDAESDRAVCACLYKLLPTLKPDYAEIIRRADILGEPRDRIAESLGTTLNNVSVRLHRGRQGLRERLEEMCLTCPVHGFLDCRCDEAARIRKLHAVAP
jgi:RNA polymerase sigma factor (sigma-70 family)